MRGLCHALSVSRYGHDDFSRNYATTMNFYFILFCTRVVGGGVGNLLGLCPIDRRYFSGA